MNRTPINYIRYDQLKLRYAVAVVFIFGFISLLSYFNELAKAGLLQPKNERRTLFSNTPGHIIHKRSTELSPSKHRELHSLNINLEYLQGISKLRKNAASAKDLYFAVHLDKNTSYDLVDNSTVRVYQFKNFISNFYLSCAQIVRLGSKDSELTITRRGLNKLNLSLEINVKENATTWSLCSLANCSVDASILKQLLQHKTVNISNGNENFKKIGIPHLDRNNSSPVDTWKYASEASVPQTTVLPFGVNGSLYSSYVSQYSSNLTCNSNKKGFPANSTLVYVYPHELLSHSVRDCFRHLSVKQNYSILPNPISQTYRNTWEKLLNAEKDKYNVLYGGQAFGVCEKMKRPCLYFTLLAHPIERLVQVYYHCMNSTSNTSTSLCSFVHHTTSPVSLKSFIKRSGNSLFQKFLYYSRHCRLLGNNEVCLHDSNANFIISGMERKAHLDHVLKNLPNWFAVIGLSKHLKKSLALFEDTLQMKFSHCDTKYPKVSRNVSIIKHYKKLQKKITETFKVLSHDQDVQHWLKPDLAIYQKAVEIFRKQWLSFSLNKKD